MSYGCRWVQSYYCKCCSGIRAHAGCWFLCSTAYYPSCLPLVPLLIASRPFAHTALHGLHMGWDHASDRWQRGHIISALRSINVMPYAHPFVT